MKTEQEIRTELERLQNYNPIFRFFGRRFITKTQAGREDALKWVLEK